MVEVQELLLRTEDVTLGYSGSFSGSIFICVSLAGEHHDARVAAELVALVQFDLAEKVLQLLLCVFLSERRHHTSETVGKL